MRYGLAMVLAAGMLMGAIATAVAVAPSDSLQGVWLLSSGEAEGKVLTQAELKAGKLIIQDDKYTVTLRFFCRRSVRSKF